MTSHHQRASAWRVGVLFSQSGTTCGIEQTQLNATLLAIDEINAAGGILDRPVEPVIYDPASDPKQFRALAERLFLIDGVRLLFGCYMSSTRKAVLPVAEANRGLLFYPTLYEGFEYSRHCVYTGAAPNQNSLQLAKFLLSTYGNRFLLVGSNYIYPYESNRLMTDFVMQDRGKILDEIYVPLRAEPADFTKVIARIKKTAPDVIFSTVVGQSTATFYQAYRAAGFDPAKLPIASLTTSEAEVAEMGAEAAEGHITAAPFFETLSTASARRFVASFKAKYGPDAPVTAAAEAAYFQVHLAMRAIGRCGTDEPDRVIAQLHDAEFDAPQGRVRIDPSNNHTYLWPRIARLDQSGRFRTVWNPGVRIKPDPYCVVQSLDDWSADDLQTAPQ
ncbi:MULTISPECIES: transporter substrate-binding domain-containing protein [Rhodopseudomonas]|uniref:Amino acid ABC transporter substrate-binding protein n=1 Tax=Rhodopseudomonas palustris TaxID=1076 RepID=A0A0D7E0T8_RHOPL|nr:MULTISPECIES: transporter substrate-binding domain-containing protein [Rhodopseudomonas]KIZ34418.1 amino acid ABC transporter substrate-binding protein [Rhodopseudomonas palustris]MDF3810313.1 transporter substrate-binding domain-containing protein [Rhodopseudomonas sp. BAL398]WOK19895.1 transporter substrate-binding domain-containing protein [Rhodopseudomonas sp. BAL398]